MKKIFVFIALLTSSLASVAEDATDLDSEYYVGLNSGIGLGGGLGESNVNIAIAGEAGIVFGYHYDKNSKFELEYFYHAKGSMNIGSNVGLKEGMSAGNGLLASYRFYPTNDSVKLYISGGLGPHFQLISLNIDIGASDEKGDEPNKEGGNVQQAEGVSSLDKVLDHIAYKLRVGIDYKIIQRMIGTIGVAAGGQLLGLKELKMPNVTLEAGIRYNF